jgi:hypothetical protein
MSVSSVHKALQLAAYGRPPPGETGSSAPDVLVLLPTPFAAGAGPSESGHTRCCCFPERFLLFVEVFLGQIGRVGLLHV